MLRSFHSLALRQLRTRPLRSALTAVRRRARRRDGLRRPAARGHDPRDLRRGDRLRLGRDRPDRDGRGQRHDACRTTRRPASSDVEGVRDAAGMVGRHVHAARRATAARSKGTEGQMLVAGYETRGLPALRLPRRRGPQDPLRRGGHGRAQLGARPRLRRRRPRAGGRPDRADRAADRRDLQAHEQPERRRPRLRRHAARRRAPRLRPAQGLDADLDRGLDRGDVGPLKQRVERVLGRRRERADAGRGLGPGQRAARGAQRRPLLLLGRRAVRGRLPDPEQLQHDRAPAHARARHAAHARRVARDGDGVRARRGARARRGRHGRSGWRSASASRPA